MQQSRYLVRASKKLNRSLPTASLPRSNSRDMSVFWPRQVIHHSPGPLNTIHQNNWMTTPFNKVFDDTFRELEQLSNHMSLLPSSSSNQILAWSPKFDIEETSTEYKLAGEIPGVESKDVTVEFIDDNTLVIKGSRQTITERGQLPQRPSSTPQDGGDRIDAQAQSEAESKLASPPVSPPQPQTQEMSGEAANQAPEPEPESDKHHQTLEKQKPVQSEQLTDDATKNANMQHTTTTEVAASNSEPENSKSSKSTYWITERSTGSFQRVWGFPSPVDHDAVKASLKDGVLSIVVPKVKAPLNTTRKIEVDASA